jgi:hypothetical protein
MTESGSSGRPAPSGVVAGNDEWLVRLGMSAAAACGTPVDLLGEFLPMLAEAAIHGRRPEARELDGVWLGQRAAKQGVGAGQTVGLYAVGGLRLWRELPMVVRSRDRENVRDAPEAVSAWAGYWCAEDRPEGPIQHCVRGAHEAVDAVAIQWLRSWWAPFDAGHPVADSCSARMHRLQPLT